MDNSISRQWLMDCVNEGWIKFDTEKDENRFIHLVRDIAPSADIDLSGFSDKLWKAAYERGKAEVVRCKDCKHRDPEDKKCDFGHDIIWQLPRRDDWYCADGERKDG